MSAKIIIAAVAGVAVVGLAGYGLYRKFRKPVEDDVLVTELKKAAKSKADQEFNDILRKHYCSLGNAMLEHIHKTITDQPEIDDLAKKTLGVIEAVLAERKLSDEGMSFMKED